VGSAATIQSLCLTSPRGRKRGGNCQPRIALPAAAVAELSFRLTRLPTRVVGGGSRVADGELGRYGSRGGGLRAFRGHPQLPSAPCVFPAIIGSCSWCHATIKKHLLGRHSRRKRPLWMSRGVPAASGACATHWGRRALSVADPVRPGPAHLHRLTHQGKASDVCSSTLHGQSKWG